MVQFQELYFGLIIKKKYMTEKEIQLLGFSRVDVLAEEGGTHPYHFYKYDITPGLTLNSNDSDEQCAQEGKWYVQFKDTKEPIRFQKMEKVQSLINTLEKAKV
jgi:hypothetical protein